MSRNEQSPYESGGFQAAAALLLGVTILTILSLIFNYHDGGGPIEATNTPTATWEASVTPYGWPIELTAAPVDVTPAQPGY